MRIRRLEIAYLLYEMDWFVVSASVGASYEAALGALEPLYNGKQERQNKRQSKICLTFNPLTTIVDGKILPS